LLKRNYKELRQWRNVVTANVRQPVHSISSYFLIRIHHLNIIPFPNYRSCYSK